MLPGNVLLARRICLCSLCLSQECFVFLDILLVFALHFVTVFCIFWQVVTSSLIYLAAMTLLHAKGLVDQSNSFLHSCKFFSLWRWHTFIGCASLLLFSLLTQVKITGLSQACDMVATTL